MTSQDAFFTEKDYENFSFQPELSQYLQKFRNGHQKQVEPLVENSSRRFSKKEQDSQDERVILEQINKTAKSDTGFDIQYPRLSYISLEEQKDFIDIYERELNGMLENMDKNQTCSLKELKARVFSEQQDFQHFAYQYVCNNLEVFNSIPEDAKQFIEAHQLLKARTFKQNIEQYYNLQQSFGLSVGAHLKNNPCLEFQEILLQTGEVPEIENQTERFHVSFDNIVHDVAEQDAATEDYLLIHKDPAAMSLARKHEAHIVTTSSSLTTLFNNEEHDQQWDIPVAIQKPDDGNKGTGDSKKIVFFEKPLPRTVHTPRQILRSVYKRASMKHLKKGEEKPTRNFVYSLWKFGKFTVLLRCKLDAYKTDDNTQSQTFLSIAVKPEYFSCFGYERFSTSETAKLWLRSYIRPFTLVLCARIDAKTNQVLRLDELNPSDILSSGSVINIGHRFKMIYQLFCSLSEVPCDSYVLSHQSNSPFCCLYRKAMPSFTAKKPDFDLYARCSEPTSIKEYSAANIPWSGIDTEIFLTEHIEQKLIPGTFPAVTDSVLKQIQKSVEIQRRQNISHGQKKKKKKKKKTRQQSSCKSSNYRAVPPAIQQDTSSRSQCRKRLRRYHDFDAIN